MHLSSFSNNDLVVNADQFDHCTKAYNEWMSLIFHHIENFSSLNFPLELSLWTWMLHIQTNYNLMWNSLQIFKFRQTLGFRNISLKAFGNWIWCVLKCWAHLIAYKQISALRTGMMRLRLWSNTPLLPIQPIVTCRRNSTKIRCTPSYNQATFQGLKRTLPLLKLSC